MNRIRHSSYIPHARIISLIVVLVIIIVEMIPSEHRSAFAQATTNDRVTIIILDQSGSMNRNDSRGLRCSAVRLLADLATDQDTFGLIRLETTDTETGPEADRSARVLIEPIAMGYAANRSQFRSAVTCDDATNNTPIADSLQKGYALLEKVAAGRVATSFSGKILLLTDGEPRPAKSRQIDEIRKLLPQFRERNWSIDTIGLRLRAEGNEEARNLLLKMANETGGNFLGDVDDPAELQDLFVDFFAKQAGRTSVPVRNYQLRPGREEQIQVAPGTERIDILISKDDPKAMLTLVRDDGRPIDEDDGDLLLYSNDDPYYVAISLNNPTLTRVYLRSDRLIRGKINQLTTSDINLNIRDIGAVRPSNQPVTIEAFFSRRTTGTTQPFVLRGASISGVASVDGVSLPLRFVDNGSDGDNSSGDGVYTAQVAIGEDLQSYTPKQVEIKLEGIADAQRYYAQQKFEFLPVPEVTLSDPDGIIDIASDAPTEVGLRLLWQGVPVPIEGWDLEVTQQVDGAQDSSIVTIREGEFIVTISSANRLETDVTLMVKLLARDRGLLLNQTPIELNLTIRRQPGIQLFWDVPPLIPVGRETRFSAGILLAGQPISTNGISLIATIIDTRGTSPPLLLRPQSIDNGIASFTYTPERESRFELVIQAEDRSYKTMGRSFETRLIPTSQLDVCGGTSTASITRFPWLEGLRKIWIFGLPLTINWFDPLFDQSFQICGSVLEGTLPYQGNYRLDVYQADSRDRVLQSVVQDDPQIRLSLDRGISGEVQVDFIVDDRFDPSINCCRESTVFTLTEQRNILLEIFLIVVVLLIDLMLLWLIRGLLCSIRLLWGNPFHPGDILMHRKKSVENHDEFMLTEAARWRFGSCVYWIQLKDADDMPTWFSLQKQGDIVKLNGQYIDAGWSELGTTGTEVCVQLDQDALDGTTWTDNGSVETDRYDNTY